ncbi:MAG: type VI secretion system ImpM family protein, partial [Planctomycetota bacterium]
MASSPQAHSICFGKLPIAGDFLRGDGAAPEFRELDDWIQHGMYESQQRLGNGWQEQFDALPRDQFLWTNGEGVVIAGFWQSSRDSVGRRYPFLLAARLQNVKPQDYAALPFALADYFRDAATLLSTEFAGKDVVSAIETAQGLPCVIDWDSAHAQLRDSQAAATANDAWAGHADAPELLLHDLEQVASQKTPPLYSLRWPTRGADADIAFWLAAMAKFGQATPRLLMWHGAAGSETTGAARVAFCPLEPRLFAGMAFVHHDDDDAYDMGRGTGEDSRMQSARKRFAATVRADNQASA